MWVYPSDEVRTSPETTALLPQLPAESGTPKQPVPEPLNAGEAMPDGVARQPERLPTFGFDDKIKNWSLYAPYFFDVL